MGAHAQFAPSSAARWLKCPASVAIAAALPNYSSEASEEGTRVHKLIEDAIGGAPIPDDEDDDDVAYGIELTLAFVEKLGGPKTVKTETRLAYSELVWGTADVFQQQPDITTILDYKNGAMDVVADRNQQLLTYAVGALEQHGPSKYYRLVIVQPNSRTSGEQADVKQAIATLEDVERHRELIDDAVRRGLAGEAPQPGRHCRYCPAFGNCPATQELLPLIMTSIRLAPCEVPDQIAGRLLRTLRGIDDFRKGLEKDLMKRFAAGASVPDVNLGTTSTHRKWSDERLAVAELMAAYGIHGVDPVSPATAEKMGGAGRDIVGRLAFKPPGNPAIKY